MLSNLLIWILIFIVAYEILPELLCRLNGGQLDHFAGLVQCNSPGESAALFLTVFIIFFTYIKLKRKEKIVVYECTRKPPNIISLLAVVSSFVTIISSVVLWRKTGFSIIPDDSARGSLVLLYHSVFGNPLIAPFLYLSIISTTYLYIVYNKRIMWLLSIISIILGCYVTMSRGFILSALLPYIISKPASKYLKYAPILVLLFFLRDILNGNFMNYFSGSSNSIQVYTEAFGEFTNTYFGRRYAIDHDIFGNYVTFILENSVKVSGIYYVFLPIFKLLAVLGIDLPSTTLETNDSIEQNLGLTGFAGSYLSDIILFFPLSEIIIFIAITILTIIYKYLDKNEKLFLLLTAAMLLPNAFRWSPTNYAAMLSGVALAYTVVKIVLKKNMKCFYLSSINKELS